MQLRLCLAGVKPQLRLRLAGAKSQLRLRLAGAKPQLGLRLVGAKPQLESSQSIRKRSMTSAIYTKETLKSQAENP